MTAAARPNLAAALIEQMARSAALQGSAVPAQMSMVVVVKLPPSAYYDVLLSSMPVAA